LPRSCEEEYQRETEWNVKINATYSCTSFANAWMIFLFFPFVERQHKPSELKTSAAATTQRRIKRVE
jgi:hypothetical protein